MRYSDDFMVVQPLDEAVAGTAILSINQIIEDLDNPIGRSNECILLFIQANAILDVRNSYIGDKCDTKRRYVGLERP